MKLRNQRFETEKNQYQIMEFIDNGGNSTVWEINDKDKNKYALKVHNTSNQRTKTNRFRNELNFQKETKSEYIAKVVDFGDDLLNTGCDFYIMERYESNMRNYIDNIDIDLDGKISQFLSVCKGVREAHLNGVIHRDIKPENIFYSKKLDHMVLGDFGIAHFSNSPSTIKGEKLANFNYHAPEQRQNSNIEIGTYTDIYALGLILNEMFTKIIPTGPEYKKISDLNLAYDFLDDIVYKMILSDVSQRESDINRVIFEIEYGYLKYLCRLSNIKEEIKKKCFGKQSLSDQLLEQISEDVYLTNKIINNSNTNWQKINRNYHRNFSYNVNDQLVESLCIINIFNHLKHKFNYEPNHHRGLDLMIPRNMKMFNDFKEFINKWNGVEYINDLKQAMKKYFLSLLDYHAKEVFSWIEDIENKIRNRLKDAPILYIAFEMIKLVNYSAIYTSDTFEILDYMIIDGELMNTKIKEDSLFVTSQIDSQQVNTKLEKEFKFNVKVQEKNKYELVFLSSKDIEYFYDRCRQVMKTYDNDDVTRFDIEDLIKSYKSIGEYCVVIYDNDLFHRVLPLVSNENISQVKKLSI